MEISLSTCELCGDKFTPDGRRKARCPKQHLRSCATCGENFEIKANDKADKEYCSRKCAVVESKRSSICPVCGSTFSKRSKTCSRSCAAKLRQQAEKVKVKHCELCGEEFTSISSTAKFCARQHYAECVVCKKSFPRAPEWCPKTCSGACQGKLVNTEESLAKRRATSMERYGTLSPLQSEEVKERIRETNIARHGVPYAQMSQEVRAKSKATNMERYGVDHYMRTPEGKAKRNVTNVQRYGAENPFSSPLIQEQMRQTWLQRYGTEHPMQNKDVKNRSVVTNMERYGVPNVSMAPHIRDKIRDTFNKNVNDGKYVHHRVSKINMEWRHLLERTFPGVACTYEASFGRYSADISADDILIDINPTISHNQAKPFGCVIGGCGAKCDKHRSLSPSYHYDRAMVARENDVNLIQIYDWDSRNSTLELLRGKLGQGFERHSARKLTLAKISQRDANMFLSANHVQGAAKGQSHCYGLFKGDDLLAVATFGGSRFGGEHPWEFIRYAVRGETIIHGGAAKLFSAFKDEVAPTSVISYVDFNHSTKQRLFLHGIGFEEQKPTGPATVWHRIRDGKRVSNNSLHALGADRLLGTSYGSREESGLDNVEIMLLEGFLPVSTAGNRVFVHRDITAQQ